ncbi:MAG: ATP-dependent DNA helicase RecG [bacterium]
MDEFAPQEQDVGRFELTFRPGTDTRLSKLPGVGPKTAQRLAERGIVSVGDLLLTFPRKYRRIYRNAAGETLANERPEFASFTGAIDYVRKPARHSRAPLEVHVRVDGVPIRLVWFNLRQDWFAKQFDRGGFIEVEGAIEWERGLGQMSHPTIKVLRGEPGPRAERVEVEAVYSSYEGVRDGVIRAAVVACAERVLDAVAETLPPSVRADRKLLTIRECIETIHLLTDVPVDDVETRVSRARERLIYEEFFTLQAELARRFAAGRRLAQAPRIEGGTWAQQMIDGLPFELTEDQRGVLQLLGRDISGRVPMRRLLQGDVGSGKTIVALILAIMAAQSGVQTAFMAPTEVLAVQHFERSQAFAASLEVTMGLLTGSTGAAERQKLLDRLKAGELHVLFGTHALLSADVEFASETPMQPSLLAPATGSKGLGLVVIDEQHKFGVEQRDSLMAKGRDPHLLAMTATPIPRSLAHTMFGDLELAVIAHKPAERQPVRTILRPRSVVDKVHAWVLEKVQAGEQAYVIFGLVEASSGWEGRANVVDEAERLANGIYRGVKVGVLHGRMTSADKDAVMRRFSSGEIQVLCATTVVEVGVDVRNASVMVIDGADVFGLSQLHQLRGRVGRGERQSFCVLLADERAGQPAWERLESFVATTDGFKLAEIDLAMRGPGLFMGVRQAGAAEFRFADLLRDAEILGRARSDARRWILGDAGV